MTTKILMNEETLREDLRKINLAGYGLEAVGKLLSEMILLGEAEPRDGEPPVMRNTAVISGLAYAVETMARALDDTAMDISRQVDAAKDTAGVVSFPPPQAA